MDRARKSSIGTITRLTGVSNSTTSRQSEDNVGEALFDGIRYYRISDQYTKHFKNKSGGTNSSLAAYRIEPSDCIINEKFLSRFSDIQNFQVYNDDTWVLSFPKCGSTWTQEMVWLLKNNFDYKGAEKTFLRFRFPYFEVESITDSEIFSYNIFDLDDLAKLERPRFLKSHLPPELLPKMIWTEKPKMIYVTRNPKECVVSYYHHYRLWNGYTGSFSEFFSAFIADKVMYSPYWRHFLSYREKLDIGNLLIYSFEEMKKDLPSVIEKTASFLGVEITSQQLKKLTGHLSFQNIKENDNVNASDVTSAGKKVNKLNDKSLGLFRAGETSQWKKLLTVEMNDCMDAWTEKWLEGTDLKKYPS